MQSMKVSSLFTSIGCNRVVNALDWGPTGRAAYGGHNVVAIYDPRVRRMVLNLNLK